MKFSLDKTLEILERTPAVLSAMLSGLDPAWIHNNEGENTWTVKEVVAHLVVCEKTDWMTRARIILSGDAAQTFMPVDMTAHFALAKKHTLPRLLHQFAQLRNTHVSTLKNMVLKTADFKKTARHPRLGPVNLQQLLSTWTVHDLSHTAQITRIMAKQYRDNTGPFIVFLNLLKQ